VRLSRAARKINRVAMARLRNGGEFRATVGKWFQPMATSQIRFYR